MISKYEYILWDWNGTLLDDVWLCIEIMNKMLSKRKLPSIKYNEYRKIFDFPVQNYYEKAGFNFGDESFESVSVEYCDEYTDRVNECELHKDALPILDYFDDNNVSQTILSATAQHSLNKMIIDFDLESYFTEIVGQDNQLAIGKIEKGKQLVRESNVHLDKIALIGDTTHDAEVANAIGIDCILVQNGHHTKSKLEITGATMVKELLDLTSFKTQNITKH
jgi:phosphoglycolate phosphatase